METKIKKKMEKTVIKEFIVGKEIKCDCCGKIIGHINSLDVNDKNNFWGNHYYKFTSGHHDWGMDSIDSIEHKDLCSDLCLMKEIDKFLVENEYSDTKYFNVESEVFTI